MIRFAVEYAVHLRDIGPIDRYERHLLHSANQTVLRHDGSLWRQIAALVRRILDQVGVDPEEQCREFLMRLARPLLEAAQEAAW